MKVIIIGRDDHSRYIAKECEKIGILKKYYTFYYNKNNVITKILGKFSLKLAKRDRVKLKDSKVSNNIVKHIANKGLRIIFKSRKDCSAIANLVSEVLFDISVVLKLKEADIYHVASQHSNLTIKKIKRKYPNSKVILDVYCAHPEYRRKIYSENQYMDKLFLPEEYSIKRINSELKLSDHILVSSEHVKDSILSQTSINIDSDKIKVIPYASDTTNFFKNIDFTPKHQIKNILYVGQVSAQKGTNYLIEAINKINKKQNLNIKLDIIGSIISEKIYKELILNNSNINYIGYIPNKDLIKFYNNSDLFILPSLSESFGMVIAEAMCCGLPVVTTRNASWIIEDRYDGFIINENSTTSIEALMEELIKNSDILAEISDNAVNTARNYDWERYCEKMIDYIKNEVVIK